jgi:predicted DNA-binding protein with PD1-like motif
MKYKKIRNNYLIRLERGDKIIEELSIIIDKENIKSAYFTGSGSVERCTTKFYSYNKKEYIEQNFHEEMEIISLTGNIALLKGKPIIHAYVALGDINMQVRGGRLHEGTVGASCEIILTLLDSPLERKFDEDTQLNLFDISV